MNTQTKFKGANMHESAMAIYQTGWELNTTSNSNQTYKYKNKFGGAHRLSTGGGAKTPQGFYSSISYSESQPAFTLKAGAKIPDLNQTRASQQERIQSLLVMPKHRIENVGNQNLSPVDKLMRAPLTL